MTDEDCAACDFNKSGKTCLRKMTWEWRGVDIDLLCIDEERARCLSTSADILLLLMLWADRHKHNS